MSKKIYLMAGILGIVTIAVWLSHCNEKRQIGGSAINKSETTHLITGHADTTSRLQKVKGTMRLRKLHIVDSYSAPTYTGCINDTLGSVSVTARVSADSRFIDLDFAGAIAEKIITRTDTLLHNTFEVKEIDSPWFDSFAVGLITGGVVLIVYLILQATL